MCEFFTDIRKFFTELSLVIFAFGLFQKVKLDITLFEDIKDDLDFCVKLAQEESVIILPGKMKI